MWFGCAWTAGRADAWAFAWRTPRSRRWSAFLLLFFRTLPIGVFDELIDKTCRFERSHACTHVPMACAHERVQICLCVDTQKVGKTFEWFLMADDPIGRAPNWNRHVCAASVIFLIIILIVYRWVCYYVHMYTVGAVVVHVRCGICAWLCGSYVICCGGKVFCVEVPCMSWRLAWHNYGVLMYRSPMIRLKCVYITMSTRACMHIEYVWRMCCCLCREVERGVEAVPAYSICTSDPDILGCVRWFFC